jgi:hypothetical protein
MKSKHFIDLDQLFFKLKNERISREKWRDFIRQYVHHIYIGPWVTEGSVVVVTQLELWNRDARHGIVLNSNHTEPLADTIIHELLHIYLFTL